jgi:hypothetical protein
MWRIWSFATQRLQNTRYIIKTDVSIASQRLGIPRQRLKYRFPATMNRDRIVRLQSNTSQRWVEDKTEPLDKVFSHQSARL